MPRAPRRYKTNEAVQLFDDLPSDVGSNLDTTTEGESQDTEAEPEAEPEADPDAEQSEHGSQMDTSESADGQQAPQYDEYSDSEHEVVFKVKASDRSYMDHVLHREGARRVALKRSADHHDSEILSRQDSDSSVYDFSDDDANNRQRMTKQRTTRQRTTIVRQDSDSSNCSTSFDPVDTPPPQSKRSRLSTLHSSPNLRHRVRDPMSPVGENGPLSPILANSGLDDADLTDDDMSSFTDSGASENSENSGSSSDDNFDVSDDEGERPVAVDTPPDLRRGRRGRFRRTALQKPTEPDRYMEQYEHDIHRPEDDELWENSETFLEDKAPPNIADFDVPGAGEVQFDTTDFQPLDFFYKMFPETLMDEIATETNRYAQDPQNRRFSEYLNFLFLACLFHVSGAVRQNSVILFPGKRFVSVGDLRSAKRTCRIIYSLLHHTHVVGKLRNTHKIIYSLFTHKIT